MPYRIKDFEDAGRTDTSDRAEKAARDLERIMQETPRTISREDAERKANQDVDNYIKSHYGSGQ